MSRAGRLISHRGHVADHVKDERGGGSSLIERRWGRFRRMEYSQILYEVDDHVATSH